MKLKFKKLHNKVQTPRYSTRGSACFDLSTINDGTYYYDGNYFEYHTGIAVQIPEGYVGLIFPRSSNTKKDVILGNSVGVIDSDYRGWITFRYKPINDLVESPYVEGDRIGQMMIIPIPEIEFEEVEYLSETIRGENGYGSTGK